MFTTHRFLQDPFPKKFWYFENNTVSEDECEAIKDIVLKRKLVSLRKGLTSDYSSQNRSRNSYICFLPLIEETDWIFTKMSEISNRINNDYFKYDLDSIESLQFTEYGENYNGFYKKHIDSLYESSSSRKLSFTLQLCDPDDYDGGNLLLHTGKDVIDLPKNKGSISFFPSWALHEVQPVIKGTRYSLVGWLAGPRFK